MEEILKGIIHIMLGLILIILAQVAYAFGGLVIRKYLIGYNPIMVNALMLTISLAMFLPVLFYFRGEIAALNTKNLAFFALAAVLWLVAAETLYITGFQKSPSLTLATLMTLFYPLFSTILGIVFLGEVLSLKIIIGGILMAAGFVFLVT